jgi:hypothetical protein
LPLPSRSDGGDRAGINEGGGCSEKRRTVRRQADLPTNSAATWSVAAVASFPSAASIVFPASTAMAGGDAALSLSRAEREPLRGKGDGGWRMDLWRRRRMAERRRRGRGRGRR